MVNGPHHKSSMTLSKLTCQINDYSEEILDFVNADGKGELYAKFVRKFLTYIPIDYRSKDKIELFGDFTHEAFDFFLHRMPGNRKIDILINDFKDNPAITVLLASENKPFIIDSLNNLLSKMGMQAIFTFHPVINSVRDSEGLLIDIVDRKDGGINEYLVYLKILGNFSADDLVLIKSEINNVIDLVDYTYQSWQTLLNKIIDITTDIVHNSATYEKANLPAEEALDFLNWIQKNNITFLGSVDFDLDTQKLLKQEGVKDIWKGNIDEIETIIKLSNSEYYSNKLVILGKLNTLSPVHRNALVDYILVKHLDENGKYKTGTIIFGLYGTAIYFQSVKTIPILRGKMNYVLDQTDFPVNGYNAKKIKNIIESLPRDVLIQIDENDLYCTCLHMLSSMRSHKLKLFVQRDWSGTFVNVIVFSTREKLTPEVHNEVCHYLSDKFNGVIISDSITVVAQDFVHLFVTMQVNDKGKSEPAHDEIERELSRITTNWSEGLLNKLCDELGEYEGSLRHKEIEGSFPSDYRHKYDATTSIDDVHHLERATRQGKLVTNLLSGEKNEFLLRFYTPEIRLTLSDILPAIENLGFVAIDEQSFQIGESKDFKKSWIYEFKLQAQNQTDVPMNIIKKNIEEAFNKIGSGELTSDALGKLIVLAGFDWRKVKLLKAIARYLHQTGFIYGKGYVMQILVKHYQYTQKLIELFEARFCATKSSAQNVEKIISEMMSYLDLVDSSSEDKVLTNMRLIILAIVRTNFYQKTRAGNIKNYISFKFDSSKVPDLPLPIPYAEIFVYSNDFEGVHLRGGKVARGGLRWSDRGEDYRTEVLGLLKAQMTKNTVIVPVGSKGTFYVNFEQGTMSRDEYMLKVISCYKDFLRGLLDLTDNLVDGKVVTPEETIIYDDENPYLVVAADKGTATFSDHANEVSKEYNFWLDDAFASGGSVGYDHKKMGITAKGAWISVASHLYNLGIDVQKDPFTVVGIGDMSGDVFGNGMLLSKCIKLVAAFNHQHIFIDPSPDCESSFAERKRLFELPRSRWSDYDLKLISKGGGIFERSAKTITLSEEIKNLLGLGVNQIVPDELISAILKAKVDLIWNGGIGTYIKSSLENNIDIGDKANDSLRINGKDVGAKSIAEGGNLGVSQLGRVEYALNGGIINTDFIDNSAGVDCSDHEVNIKIALNLAVAKGKITIKERNDLLAKMTKQVEELVLADNFDQNLAITILSLSPTLNIESFSHLIGRLEALGFLDRAVEFLPDKAELSRRTIANQKMTRPELAVLLSYSKMALDKLLNNSTLTKDRHFKKHLMNYFPKLMHEKFKEEIEEHPLSQDIIRTIITNRLINQLSGPVVSSISLETGAEPSDIARAYEVVNEVFDLSNLWRETSMLGINVPASIKVEIFSDLAKIMRRGISWFVKNIKSPIHITETVEEYRKKTELLTDIISKLLVGTNKTRYYNKIEHYVSASIDKKLAKAIATLEVLVSAFDIIYIAKKTKVSNEIIANLYFECGDLAGIDWLRDSCELQINESYWNRLSIQSLKDDLYDKQRRLVAAIVLSNKKNAILKSWIKMNMSHAGIFIDFINQMKMQEAINLNMIILANKKLEIFLRKVEAVL